MTYAPPQATAIAVRRRSAAPPAPDPVALWGLPMLLALQVLLGLSMLSRPLVMDETTYIDAGRAEIAHWLHGAAVAGYARAFSGAPVIYPPISAAIASVFGLTGTRVLSLACMLAATALLWSTVRQLFGSRVALFAGALFVTTSATQYLGALATYDAMSLMLLAAAARCAAAVGDASGRRRIVLLAGVVAALVAANATAYPSALWDPVVIALAVLCDPAWRWTARIAVAIVTAAATVAVLALAVLAAGTSYWHGILFSTIDRTVNGGHPAAMILGSAVAWTGCLAVLAVMGATVLTAAARGGAVKLLGWILAAAVGLAPIEQARIGVIVSLFKHVGYGAWFAAIPAAYGLSTLAELALRRLGGSRRGVAARLVVAFLTTILVIAAAGAVTGIVQAQERASVPPPYSVAAVYRLKSALREHPGLILADTPSELAFYDHLGLQRFVNTYSIRYTVPGTGTVLHGAAGYQAALKRHAFSIVILRAAFGNRPFDKLIRSLLHHDGYFPMLLVNDPALSRGSDGKAVLIFRCNIPAPVSNQSPAHSPAEGERSPAPGTRMHSSARSR